MVACDKSGECVRYNYLAKHTTTKKCMNFSNGDYKTDSVYCPLCNAVVTDRHMLKHQTTDKCKKRAQLNNNRTNDIQSQQIKYDYFLNVLVWCLGNVVWPRSAIVTSTPGRFWNASWECFLFPGLFHGFGKFCAIRDVCFSLPPFVGEFSAQSAIFCSWD